MEFGVHGMAGMMMKTRWKDRVGVCYEAGYFRLALHENGVWRWCSDEGLWFGVFILRERVLCCLDYHISVLL